MVVHEGRRKWVDTNVLDAIPYDHPVPGYVVVFETRLGVPCLVTLSQVGSPALPCAPAITATPSTPFGFGLPAATATSSLINFNPATTVRAADHNSLHARSLAYAIAHAFAC